MQLRNERDCVIPCRDLLSRRAGVLIFGPVDQLKKRLAAREPTAAHSEREVEIRI